MTYRDTRPEKLNSPVKEVFKNNGKFTEKGYKVLLSMHFPHANFTMKFSFLDASLDISKGNILYKNFTTGVANL